MGRPRRHLGRNPKDRLAVHLGAVEFVLHGSRGMLYNIVVQNRVVRNGAVTPFDNLIEQGD